MMTAFKKLMETSLPEGEAKLLLESLDTPSPVSIRQHILKAEKELFPGSLPVPWCPRGRYLEERPVFTLDPRFHAGAYYVQEASGMSLWQLEPYLQKMKAPRVLDACAAPGGKSTLLLDILPGDGLLVSNEIIRPRVPVLAENLSRWGYANVVVTQNDPAAFSVLDGYFDVLVTDVPCSGEGLFRKDPASRSAWSPAQVELCAARQRRILSDLWPSLKEGGLLLYSTCTYNRVEDEDQIDWITDHLGARVILGPQKYLPHRIRGEGFFMALMEKTSKTKNPERNPLHALRGKSAFSLYSGPSEGFPKPLNGDYSWSMKHILLKAFPASLHREMTTLESVLDVVHSGIAVASRKGNDWIPYADLALATDLNKEAYPNVPLDTSQALAFLRRDSLTFPPDTEKGYLLLTFDNLPLGFVNNLGNRSNNLHPLSRRILIRPQKNPDGNQHRRS